MVYAKRNTHQTWLCALLCVAVLACGCLCGCAGQSQPAANANQNANATAQANQEATNAVNQSMDSSSSSDTAAAANAENTTNTSNEATNQASDSTTKEKVVLRVGVDIANGLHGFVSDAGECVGYETDLAAAVASYQGWGLEIIPIDWDERYELLEQGAIDCIWGGLLTSEAQESCYTVPYMRHDQAVIVRWSSSISVEKNLSHKNVAFTVGTAAQKILQGSRVKLASLFESMVGIDDMESALVGLTRGVYDAIVCDSGLAKEIVEEYPDSYKIGFTLDEDAYAVGFLTQKSDLAKKVAETFASLNRDGTAKQLCEKYASYGVRYDEWAQLAG